MKRNNVIFLLAASLALVSCDSPSHPIESATSDSISESGSESASEPTSEASVPTSVDPIASVDDLLEKISNPLALKGTYELRTVDESGATIDVSSHLDISSYVSADHHFYKSGHTTYEYFKDEDGYAITRSLNPSTNEISSEVVYTYDYSTGEVVPMVFSNNVDNPFAYLDKLYLDSFSSSEAVFNLNESLGQYIASILTKQRSFTPSTIKIGYAEDKITTIEFSQSQTIETTNYYHIASFTVVDESKIPFGNVAIREETTATNPLATLFTNLKNNNYTVTTTIIDNVEETAEVFIVKTNELGYLITEEEGTEGYINTDSTHYAPVIVDVDNKLQGTLPPQQGEITDEVNFPEFNYLDYMFDASSDGSTFTLPNITGLYDYELIPEMLPSKNYVTSYTPDDGSLKITFNADNTYTFSYDFTNIVGENVYTDVDIISVVSNVGNTSLGYTIDDYIEFVQPTSWADVRGASDIFSEYKMPISFLPFLYIEGLVWVADTITLDNIGAHSIPDTETPSSIRQDFVTLLTNDGWTEGIDFHGDVSYSKFDSASGYTFSVSPIADNANNDFTIWFNASTHETNLSRWINTNFENGNNYTLAGNIIEKQYPIDIETGEVIGDPTVYNYPYEARAISNAYYQEYTIPSGTERLYYEDTATGTNRYVMSSTSSTWSSATSFEDVKYTDHLETLHGIVGYDLYDEDATTPGNYTVTDSLACLHWASIFNVDFSDNPNTAEVTNFIFDEAQGTLSFTEIVAYVYLTDGQNAYMSEFSVDMAISNVGTTTMSGIDLPTA